MKGTLTIREIEEKDLQAIAKIYSEEELLPGIEDVSTIVNEGLRSPFIHIFVAEKGKEVIAAITWEEYERLPKGKTILEIGYLAVKENYQRRGIGKMIFNRSWEMLRQKLKAKGLEIHLIFATTTRGDIGFYQKLGMEKSTEVKDFWKKGKNMFFMTKIV